ncbi:MAG: pyridoxamine 5'-phosphate oxidase family protein [Prevotella sp.]|nr:pyridoxamine 5'-phosphate oxidase family protein [Prevotella sp.]
MKFCNEDIRRQDRCMDEERSRELLMECEYAVLSLVDSEGMPYGVPVNFVFERPGHLYIHSAPEGRKLQCLAQHPHVSMCMVGYTHVLASQFTTEYESVLLTGIARTALSEEEKKHALSLLVEKYSPDFRREGSTAIRRSLHRTEVIRIDIETFSGKHKIKKRI